MKARIFRTSSRLLRQFRVETVRVLGFGTRIPEKPPIYPHGFQTRRGRSRRYYLPYSMTMCHYIL